MITIKRFTAIITALILCLSTAAHAYNVVDLPETMTFDEAVGIFNSDDIERAIITDYADRQYVELSKTQISELYDGLKGITLKRGTNPMPFRGTVLYLFTDGGSVKNCYVSSGVELGRFGSSNYICYNAISDEDRAYLTNIESIYRDSTNKTGGEEFYRALGNDFLRLPAESWGHTPVREAAENNLLPYQLTKKYDDNISREEFCILLANLISIIGNYASLEGYMQDNGIAYSTDTFTDCAGRDSSIFMLNAMGIISGRDEYTFDPGGAITREEAATLLCRTAERFMFIETGEDLYFADANYIAPWAKYYVIWVNEQSIMNGDEGNFRPNDTYTVLQAITTVNRLYKVILRNINI